MSEVQFKITAAASSIEKTVNDGETVRKVVYRAGDVVDLAEARARQLQADGVGEIVGGSAQAEEAPKNESVEPDQAEDESPEESEGVPFAVVVSLAKEMVDNDDDLTKTGKPELVALRLRVKDAGYDPDAITSAVRDAAYEEVSGK